MWMGTAQAAGFSGRPDHSSASSHAQQPSYSAEAGTGKELGVSPSPGKFSDSSAEDAREGAVLGVGRAMRPLDSCTQPGATCGTCTSG